jgi:hypothetical protein
MRKTVFISCGQFTTAEKALGKQIAELVRTLTDLEPFFAEEVQDLNGLDANILGAMRNCVAFITVLHPRGEITRPDGSKVIRASVWIEQEIAVATYIQRVENRTLPIIAFKHKSVSHEGIRNLLNLNPTEFTTEEEVLAELPKRLESWKLPKPSEIELRLTSKAVGQQEGHAISNLQTALLNETNYPIEKYDLELRLPSSILKHWSSSYPNEVPCNEPGIRCFRFDHLGFGTIRPRHQRDLASYNYCTQCAVEDRGEDHLDALLVSEAKIGVRAFVNGEEYRVEKTIKQLAMER